jgi:hypothetical protein
VEEVIISSKRYVKLSGLSTEAVLTSPARTYVRLGVNLCQSESEVALALCVHYAVTRVRQLILYTPSDAVSREYMSVLRRCLCALCAYTSVLSPRTQILTSHLVCGAGAAEMRLSLLFEEAAERLNEDTNARSKGNDGFLTHAAIAESVLRDRVRVFLGPGAHNTATAARYLRALADACRYSTSLGTYGSPHKHMHI